MRFGTCSIFEQRWLRLRRLTRAITAHIHKIEVDENSGQNRPLAPLVTSAWCLKEVSDHIWAST